MKIIDKQTNSSSQSIYLFWWYSAGYPKQVFRNYDGIRYLSKFLDEASLNSDLFREYDEKVVYLREQLIAELEEKQRLIEQERSSMELTGRQNI